MPANFRESGDRAVMPDGFVFDLVTPTEQTGGEYVEMIFEAPPEGESEPPPHVHPIQTEEYEVLTGELKILVGRDWITLTPGQRASVPPGVRHTFHNASSERATARNWHRPAVGFQEFIGELEQITASPKFKGVKHPGTAVRLAMLFTRHADTLVATGPTRAAFATANALGKALRISTY